MEFTKATEILVRIRDKNGNKVYPNIYKISKKEAMKCNEIKCGPHRGREIPISIMQETTC